MAELGCSLTMARGPRWPNRVGLAPMTTRQSHSDGTLSDDELTWLVRRARGGFGLVMTCAAHVSRSGQGWPGELGIFSDDHLPGLTRLASALDSEGAVTAVQLHHGGWRADPALVTDRISPWDDPESGARAVRFDEIDLLVAEFVAAARRAEAAGFHGVEVHGGHGYLIAQFLDGEKNRRTDGYGGTLDGRARFLFEVLSGIRSAVGTGFQVGLRLSPERYGMMLPEAKYLAERVLASDLIDYLDMSLWDVFKTPVETEGDGRTLLDHFAELERGTARLGVAGKVLSARDAQRCLDGGADFVTIGTAAILHHDFAQRAIADVDFESGPLPAPVDWFRRESVSDPFIAYLREIKGSSMFER